MTLEDAKKLSRIIEHHVPFEKWEPILRELNKEFRVLHGTTVSPRWVVEHRDTEDDGITPAKRQYRIGLQGR